MKNPPERVQDATRAIAPASAPASPDTIAVVGLGYVGLPLAVAFARRYRTIGFDLSQDKIAAYREKRDPTGEVTREELEAARHLTVTDDAAALRDADFIIVPGPAP